jgi:hypothetical protein
MNDLADFPAHLPSAPTTRPFSHWFDPMPDLGISLIDHLFNRLDGAYPGKWRQNFKNQQAIDNWAESWVEAFEEEGITPHDVKVGLRECRKRFGWPPSVAEFMQACRPALDPLKAYYEAVNGVQARVNGEMGEWSHPAIYWAAMPIAVELREQAYSHVRARWETSLAKELAKTEWAEIPRPMKALAAPGKSATGTEKARQAIKQAADQVMHTFAGTAWARKLLERHKAGERLTPTQVLFARQALGQA